MRCRKLINRLLAIVLILGGFTLAGIQYMTNRSATHADVLIKANQIQKAIAVVEPWDAYFPGHPYLGLELGRGYIAANELPAAISTLEAVTKNDYNTYAKYHLGLAYEKSMQFEKAQAQYEQILAYSTRFPLAERALIRLKAIKLIHRLSTETPAVLKLELPVLEKTLNSLLAADPDNAAITEAALVIGFLQNDRSVLEAAAAKNPVNSEIWLLLDDLRNYLADGNFEKCFETIKNIKSRNPRLPTFLVQFYFLLADIETDRPVIQSRLLLTRAEILLAGGNQEKAVELLVESRKLDPENSATLTLLDHIDPDGATAGSVSHE